MCTHTQLYLHHFDCSALKHCSGVGKCHTACCLVKVEAWLHDRRWRRFAFLACLDGSRGMSTWFSLPTLTIPLRVFNLRLKVQWHRKGANTQADSKGHSSGVQTARVTLQGLGKWAVAPLPLWMAPVAHRLLRLWPTGPLLWFLLITRLITSFPVTLFANQPPFRTKLFCLNQPRLFLLLVN